MFYLVLSLHIFLCLALIVLVLLQQGKGASAGAILGGSSNTLFGAAGANTVLTKVTTGFAIAFMFTSVVLVKLYGSHSTARVGEANPLSGSVMNERVVAPVADSPAEAGAPVDTGAAPVAPAAEGVAAQAPVAKAPVAKEPVAQDQAADAAKEQGK